MKLLGAYKNGNYATMIFDDGTKVRKTDDDVFIPDHAENMDIKITNYCDMGCPFCHEGSALNGCHADILNQKFIDTLHEYQEVAIGGGDATSHPDLIPFLRKLKDKKVIANMPFNDEYEDGCNNWRTSSLRKWLNSEFLDKNFGKGALLANFSTLTADNGDDKYGVVEDYVTLLDCDQYRRYRKLMPKYDDWVWTLTPRSCTVGDAFSVRNIIPSGELDSYFADNTYGVAPACLFNLNYLSLCRQARIITHK